MDYDDTPDPRFEIGEEVRLADDFTERRYEDQDNDPGPRNGETILGDVATTEDVLEVVSFDWEGDGFAYHLRNSEGSRLWSVPEEDLDWA
jgi:hypothetical protein